MTVEKVGIRERRPGRILGYMAIAAMAVSVCVDAQAALTSKSYIMDGLLVQYDGIENVGRGQPHDSTATTWADLSGSGLNMLIPVDSAFTNSSGLATLRAHGSGVVDGRIPEKDQKIRAAQRSAKYTTEITYDMTTAPGDRAPVRMLILGNITAFIGAYYWDGGNRIGLSANYEDNGDVPQTFVNVNNADRTGLRTFTCRQDLSNAVVRMYCVATDKSYSATKTGIKYNTDLSTAWKFKFNRGYSEPSGMNGVYYSVRVYDRSLTDDEISINNAVDRIRYCGATVADFTLPDGWRFTTEGGDTNLERRLSVSVKDGVGGTIAVDGGAAGVATNVWCEWGETIQVALVATPAEGYAFVGWMGLDEADKYTPSVTVSIDADVVAVFRRADGTEPYTYSWKGTADGAWDDNANWADQNGLRGVPAQGDSVVVPSGFTATATNSTVAMADVAVSGTLVLTNWETRLNAQSVTVANGGNLTCGAPTTNMTTMSRVWVACSNLTVDAGGKIDVTRKGYYGHVGVLKRGYGPGSASGGMTPGVDGGYAAPSHGGYGGWYLGTEYCFPRLLPYDDPASPSLPGSSGASNDQSYGGDGGGVVRIEATGTVTINGSILADGRNSSSYGTATTSSNHGQPGSGGSIWITCGTIAGSGVIRAAGGGGDNAPYFTSGIVPAAPAGGGMIAIDYDPARQTAEAVEGMTISSAAGLHKTKNFATTCVNADTNHWGADIGTLHFTDEKIVDALLGKSLTGQIRGLSSYTYDGDLVFTNGHVRFADIGVAVAVNGDLELSGDGVARLEVGGCVATNRYIYTDLYAGSTPCSLTVSGDLTLGGMSRLDIHAAATNGVDAFGALVNVAGAMTIGSNCVVTATSDLANLGAPKFTVGSLMVATGGVFTADERGGRGGYGYRNAANTSVTQNPNGAGPGRGASTTGASYGGKGGGSSQPTYGGNERPLLPGSGGSCYSFRVVGGAGGGLLYVSAPIGAIAIYGIVSADGGTGAKRAGESRVWGYGGGGSGGAILLESRFFRLGETGVLTARGGDTEPYTTVKSGAGGGGRIAVWCGAPWREDLTRAWWIKSSEPLDAEAAAEFFTWEGSASVTPGAVSTKYVSDVTSLQGKDGTLFFGFVRDQPLGALMIFR